MPIEYRKPLRWGEYDPNRRENTRIDMWAWLWQRISALAIIVLLALHVTLTYKPIIQFLLLIAVAFHASLGIRVILLDFNLVGVKYRRALIWGLTGLGMIVIAIIWRSTGSRLLVWALPLWGLIVLAIVRRSPR